MGTMAERNRANGMVNRDHKKREVELRYEEPFWKVVCRLAKAGYSKAAVARELGWSEKAFLKMVKDEMPGIRWPTIKEQAAARKARRGK